MEAYDDDLSRFEADGAVPLPVTHEQGYVEHDGARIWYAAYGSGPPVLLLSGPITSCSAAIPRLFERIRNRLLQ